MGKGGSDDGTYPVPWYAIIPRLGVHVNLHDDLEFGKSQPQHTGSNGLAPLEAIQHMIDALSEGKKTNASKQFAILKRILGVAR